MRRKGSETEKLKLLVTKIYEEQNRSICFQHVIFFLQACMLPESENKAHRFFVVRNV